MPRPRRIYLGEEYRPIQPPTIHAYQQVAVEFVRRRGVIRMVADPRATDGHLEEFTLAEFFEILGITKADIRRAWGELPPLDAEVIEFVQEPLTEQDAERIADIMEVAHENVE